jgi:DNA-binding GntR family transcriptional regulator
VAQHEAILARAAAGDARAAASATRENWLELGALIERTLTRATTPAG